MTDRKVGPKAHALGRPAAFFTRVRSLFIRQVSYATRKCSTPRSAIPITSGTARPPATWSTKIFDIGRADLGELITGVTDVRGLILAAAAASASVTMEMVEASRDEMDLAGNLRFREVAENLADALQFVCSIELESEDLPANRREAIGDLLAASSRFIEGWA